MSRTAKIAVAALVLLAVGVGGAALWFSNRGDAPDRVALSTRDDTTTTAEGDAPEGDVLDDPEVAAEDLDGSWTVEQGDTTVVGYRVGEEFLGGVGRATGVGRTGEVTGSLTIDGTTVTAVELEVDMTTLRSDEDRRDNRLRTSGIETDAFPTSTFVLTEPIDLGALPAPGREVSVVAVGELTLRGVTRSVEIPLDAVLRDDGRVEVAGSLPVAMADYDIEPPSISGFVTVDPDGELELQVTFARDGA